MVSDDEIRETALRMLFQGPQKLQAEECGTELISCALCHAALNGRRFWVLSDPPYNSLCESCYDLHYCDEKQRVN